MDLTPDEPRPEDVILLRALFGAVRWYHCPPHTRIDIGCIHSGSPWNNSELVLIDSEWRWITISHVLIGSARRVTCRS
jgi:hypothetical protein